MTDIVFNEVHLVEAYDKFNAVAEEAFGFEWVRYGTGGVTPGNATTATEAKVEGLALNEAKRQGEAVVVLRYGLVDVGDALDPLNAGDDVHLSDTDGTAADAAGTTPKLLGRVQAVWNGSGYDKYLLVDCR
jgi:hypothetical protein